MSDDYKPHELAEIFPRADSLDTARIKNDIVRYGCRVPIVLYEGKILDGLTRYDICKRYRKKPHFRMFTGTREEAIAHVTSLNLCRRHLTQAQKSAVAVSLKRLLEHNGSSPSESIAEVAQAAKVSEGSVRRMERIDGASKSVAKKVRDGRLSLAAAEREITAPTNATIARKQLLYARAALARAQHFLLDAPGQVDANICQAINRVDKALSSEWFED